MRSYPFINDLFTNVLQKSKAIAGRFFVSSRQGLELNSDTVGQLISEVTSLISDPKKYPLVMMMPPISRGRFNDGKGEWKSMRVVLFFLKTTYYDGYNQVSDLNQFTQTSMHTVLQDWHDMERCAINFIRVLDKIQRAKSLVNTSFRMDPSEKFIVPVSTVGQDRVSGVRLDFNCSVLVGCEMEDYNEEDLENIIVPVADSHPEHLL